jgi:hypothetical protein
MMEAEMTQNGHEFATNGRCVQGGGAMKRLLVCAVAACMLLGALSALGEQAENVEMTLDFSFGQRAGLYTGTMKDGLPDGEGSFITENTEQQQWTYTGTWVAGHLEGQGASVWEDGWRDEGTYANDMLNGAGAEYYDDVLVRQGTYENGQLVRGSFYTDSGILYYEGEANDWRPIESQQARAARLDALLADVFEVDDYDAVWRNYDSYIGEAVLLGGTVSYLWTTDDTTGYCDFALDIEGDADHWTEVFGHASMDETVAELGEENLLVFGYVLPKYEWSDESGTYETPIVQCVAMERVGFETRRLSKGSKGDAVVALQQRLSELGYYAGAFDGDYGNGTKNAVAAFQTAEGLPADGVASLRTLYVLYGD